MGVIDILEVSYGIFNCSINYFYQCVFLKERLTNIPIINLMRMSTVLSLVLGWFLVSTFASYADYQPQGGDPPRGGSTTSGMRF